MTIWRRRHRGAGVSGTRWGARSPDLRTRVDRRVSSVAHPAPVPAAPQTTPRLPVRRIRFDDRRARTAEDAAVRLADDGHCLTALAAVVVAGAGAQDVFLASSRRVSTVVPLGVLAHGAILSEVGVNAACHDIRAISSLPGAAGGHVIPQLQKSSSSGSAGLMCAPKVSLIGCDEYTQPRCWIATPPQHSRKYSATSRR